MFVKILLLIISKTYTNTDIVINGWIIIIHYADHGSIIKPYIMSIMGQ